MREDVEFAKKYGDISLAKFLSRFVSLYGKDLKKVTHNEVKILFPNLKRCSFNKIKENPMLIYDGDVILVDDGKTIIPYYIPKEETLNSESTFIREKVKEREIDDSYHDYASMSIYELRCLLERKYNSCRNQCAARRELNKRGVVLHKKYKRSEEKRKGFE